MSAAERSALGVTWTGIRLEQTTSVRNRDLTVIARGALHEGIGSGDPVVVANRNGRCVGWEPHAAELVFERVEWTEISEARTVDLGFDASVWVRYRQALERADELDSPLKHVLLHGPSDDRHDGYKNRADWEGLNESQIDAAQAALDGGPLAVIHGPPGTGKTRTLVALLGQVTGVRWALAESNAAVDNLALGAARAGLSVARVGPTFRMSGPVRALAVETQVDEGPHAQAIEAINKEITRSQGTQRELHSLFDQRRQLRSMARRHVLESVDVIATTFGTLARRADELPRADLAVVDEVTQALEPAIWTAVPHVERLVLAGDPHQLGPVVLEPGNPLETGILDRLGDLGVAMPMLTVQHRMHRDIMGLVTDVYGPSYTAHRSVADHLLAEADGVELTATTSAPVLFVDTTQMAPEQRDPVSRSVLNPIEADLVGIALGELRAAGVAPEKIGVIAPYSAQVARLAALPEAAGVEVATVNAFQGREADAILVSFTRSNDDGELGFLADRRRLTVAITRARRFLWMCGDSVTLSRNADFAALVNTVGRVGTVQSIWEPPWSTTVL